MVRWSAGPLCVAALFALSLSDAPACAQGRFDNLTRKFASTPDQAKVLAATYLGGAGTEWLVGGGVQPDGTVVVAGVSLGPALDLGVKEVVLGRDAPAPPAPQPRHKKAKDGTPLVNKAGQPIYEPFPWTHENATTFVVRLSSDLRTIKSVSRFPWRAGGVTGAAVDDQGAIYLTGPATDLIAATCPDAQALPVTDNGNQKPACSHVYLAKLNSEASQVVWARHMKGPSNAPDLDLDSKGGIKFQGPDLRTFNAKGKQESVVVVPGGLSGRVAVNPLDGTYARGGEHHWPTGREPYRDPILNIHRPDGTLLYELYNWDGPFVGLDNLRLVSDSAIRGVCYDDQGNLIVHAWSDGGNSVMYREPNDIRTASSKMTGLGMSAWGAGVLSCAYIVKIETKNYKVAGGTLWLAFLKEKDKPNSIWIDKLGFAGDGSVCIAGRSAWGLIETGNKIGNIPDPAGPYVSVLSADCASLRFSSAMPACGKADVRDGESWGIAKGTRDKKPVVMFLTGAIEQEDQYGSTAGAPAVNALQGKFGGGFSDGYVVVLDLSGER